MMSSHRICEPHNERLTITVLQDLLNIQNEEEPFVPSEYFNEMQRSLEDRLEGLSRNRRNRAPKDPSPFLATPDIIIFQNYEPGKWYNATLTLQNKEQTSRCIKVVFESTVHFRLVYPSKVVWTKVAPGMTYQLIVSFRGDELRNYDHKVVFVTENEQFTIPIYGFKPKPLIDFPDFVRLPDVPIHMTSEKNIILCNHGSVIGTFNLIATDLCNVCPSKIILKPKEKIFVKISLKTDTGGLQRSSIIVRFDDDVKLKFFVECNSVSSTILLQNNSINFEDTFMDLQRQVPLTIEYHGIGFGYFKWKRHKSPEEDKLKIAQFKEAFEEIKEHETRRFVPLARNNVIDQPGHSMVYERILTDEVEEVEENEEFEFQHTGFKIIPLSGEMGMNGLLEFTVIFSPTRSEKYETVAYLEIAGKEERIPLKLQGIGLGPQFKINIAHLEANNVFLRSVHDYEIIVANTGHIPGSISYIKKKLEFGGKIKCYPPTLYINANHYAAFVVSFIPGEEGKFIEKIEFTINESHETIHFIMTGNVLAPLLNLEVSEIDFGVVPLGYKTELEVVLYNNSPVPIEYNVEIVNDGYQQPISSEAFLEDIPLPPFPKEFSFDPEEGIVDDESKVVGTLSLIPNQVREMTTDFVVHMWGSKNYCLSVPLKYNCKIAEVVCIPPKVDIKFCFINYVYDRKIILKNKSDLPCHFKFLTLENEEMNVVCRKSHGICVQKGSGLTVEVTVLRNYIPPLGEVKISLKIQTPLLGVQEIPLHFDIFGKGPENLCNVICNGQGPAICFVPPNLNFGKVTLLKTVTKELEVLNDTPIPATINFYFKNESDFRVKEITKEIPPNSKQELEVSVYLRDPGKYSKELLANVEQGQEMAVTLSAYGTGTSINCIPKLEPKYDLGTLLTYKKMTFPFLLRNEGSRWHKLWLSRSDNMKIVKDSPNSSAGMISVFKITPHYFPLMSTESMDVNILATRKEQGHVSEQFYCHAVIEKSHDRHIIFSFELVAKFVDPYVEVSKSELNFCLNVSAEQVYTKLREKIKIRNQSGLTLDVELVIAPPFYIVVDDKVVSQLHMKLNNLSNRKVYVEFYPPPHIRRCATFNQTFYFNYKDHPKVDSIPVRGIINYPTVIISPPNIDFGSVPLGSSTYRAVTLSNKSPLPVIYKWVWTDDIIQTKFETSVIPSSPENTDLESYATITIKQESEERVNTTCSQELSQVESTESCLVNEKMKDILNSLLDHVDENQEEQAFLRHLPEATLAPKLSQIVTIIPHEGCLEPEESITTYFRFTPESHTEISGVVFCHIAGGGNEAVTITGKCKKNDFYLKSNYINFGNIYFYDSSENETVVINDCDSTISFTVTEQSPLLSVEPLSGKVPPGSSFPLILKYFPCTVGRFQTSFNIEVDYLDPVTVTVVGFGVYPQIYLALPRPEMDTVDPYVAYAAIAELDYETDLCRCGEDYISHTDRRILAEDGWVVITLSHDHFPCTMEMELSIERIWAKFQSNEHPELIRMYSKEKAWPIPDFVVAAYVLDLGYVQIDTKQVYTLTYLNYGPGKTVVKVLSSPTFNKHGFQCSFLKHIMDLKQVSNLKVTFTPSSDTYKELHTQVNEFIYFDVRNGPRVPVQLQVLVTTPTVTVSSEEIDFGSIRCGDCLRNSINIINDGYLTSRWEAMIDESLKNKQKQKPSFFLMTHEGSLEPGEKFYLRVYFEPQYDDYLDAQLMIMVEGNSRETMIHLKGFGMEPFLEIKEDRIVFEPNIPYSDDNDNYVTIRNISNFPVEYFFPDFDAQILQEETFVRAFIVSNVINKAYFSYRPPGEPLPAMFQEHYDKLLTEVESKLEKRSESDAFRTQSTPVLRRKSIQSKEDTIGPVFLEKESLMNSCMLRKMKLLRKRSSISHLKRLTPDSQVMYRDPPLKGTLLVFHGAPFSSYIKAAHETGKSLQIPVLSIDRLIIDYLVKSSSEAASTIKDLIDQAFQDVAEDSELESVIAEDSFDVLQKKIHVLLEGRPKRKKPKKTESLNKKLGSGKSSKSGKSSNKTSEKSSKGSKSKSDKSTKSSNKSSKTKKSEGSEKAKKKKQKITDTLINLPQSLLRDVFEEATRNFPKGIIIESLCSNFLRKPMVAMDCVLQLSRNVDAIYFVICLYTFEDYLQLEEIKDKNITQQANENTNEILASVDEMVEEEFEKFRKEHPEIYKTYLKKRHEEIKARKEFIKILKAQKMKAAEAKTERSKSKLKMGGASTKSLDKKSKSNKSMKSKENSSKGSKKSKKSKDSTKTKKSSKKSSKKSKSSGSKKSSKKSSNKSPKQSKKKKLTKEQVEVKQSIDSFESSLEEIFHILEFWDKETGTLTKPFTKHEAKPAKKKPTKSAKSSSRTHGVSSSSVGNAISEIGIPCWVIRRVPHNPIEDLVPNFMKATVEAEMSHRQEVKKELIEPPLMQSVLSKPRHRIIRANDAFSITDFTEENNKESNSAVNLFRGKGSQIKKIDDSNASFTLVKPESFTTRKLLQPGESFKYKISFLPEVVGNYKHNFEIGIIGWPSKFHITCIGSCDIPKIDVNPNIIFDRIVEQRTDRNKHIHRVFVEENSTFEFGGILLPNPETNNTFEKVASFHVNNISRMTCEISYILKADSPAFHVKPTQDVMEPKGKRDLIVTAAPLEEKVYQDSLLFTIKNNPKIKRVKISCYGCDGGVDVNPKHVVFERVSLATSVTKYVIITNNTPVQLTWYFVNYQEVLENFKLRALTGSIPAFSCQRAAIEFTAKEMEIKSSTFQIQLFDSQSRLVYSTDIMVSAETTALEFHYTNMLDFGDVKGKVSHHLPFKITTKGRYEILCKFVEIVENDLEQQNQRKYFKIEPMEIKLQPNNEYEAGIIFSPDNNIILDKFPVFKCSLIDPFHQVEIKSFDIYISARAFLSKFEMCPYPEIYFGHQTVGLEQAQFFQILNKGRFDFDYIIEGVERKEEKKEKKGKKDSKGSSKKSKGSAKSKSSKSKSSKKSKESSKSKKSESSSKKSKGSKKSKKSKSTEKFSKENLRKKQKPTTLKLGVFSITSSTGTIYPNEEAVIEVRSKPTHAGEFHESIIVNVSQPSQCDAKGKLFHIHTIACEPKVNFDDLYNIFKEQYTVEKLDDYFQHNTDAKVVFAKSEMILKFNNVCINTTEVTRIRIQNVGHVTAHVTAHFLKPNFTVSPNSFSIDSFETKSVLIAFSPTSLDEYRSILTLECRGSHSTDRLTVEVVGEVCVPEVAVLEPAPNEASSPEINYFPTLLGESSLKNLVIKNVGAIECKVILEVCFDDHDQLALIPAEETIPLLNFWNPNETMRHTNMVNLSQEAVAKFILKFEPVKTGTWKMEVKMHYVNNPFETKSIYVFCGGYYSDVILQGMFPYSRSGSLKDIGMIGYSLNFGDVGLNTIEKKCFRIRNNSEEATYKFEFPNFNEVIFSPAVGHLRPKTSKQVLAVFLSKYAVKFSDTQIECNIYKIEYLQPQPDLLSWDDRQHLVFWCEETLQSEINLESYSVMSYSRTLSKTSARDSTSTISDESNDDSPRIKQKIVEENPEPKINVIPESSQSITLFLSAAAGYACFACETQELEIPDTFVMNKKSVSFDVVNTGKVVLKISFSISMNDLPRRINSCKVEPIKEQTFLPSCHNRTPTPLLGNEQFLFEDPPRPNSAHTLFSSESAETCRSCDSWSDRHNLPFIVTPDKADIQANSKQTFTVTFAPLDVFDYEVQLKSKVENKEPLLKEIEIGVKARSILPVYCFELEPSDYVETRRRGKKICNDLFDENTKVVEFESVGLGVICTRKFHLKNPTKEEFFYTWRPAHPIDPHLSCFHCHTPNGTIAKGKTVEIVFSFISQECGLFEEFYLFTIPLRDITVTFLLVGTAREPRIYFDSTHVDLPPTVLGIDVSHTVTLRNEEKENYNFKFGQMSMLSEGLSVQPTSGVLAPQENFPIRILYSPKKQSSVNVDVKCFVEKIHNPLELSIAYTCYKIEAVASYPDRSGKEIQLYPDKLNTIKMGAMIPHQKYEVPISVTNIGKIGFQWFWQLSIQKISGFFDVTTEKSDEFVQPNETLRTKLEIVPLLKCTMQQHKIVLKIPYGPTYPIQLTGTAGSIPFKFSFAEYNFGRCLLQTSSTKYYKTILKFSNYDIWPMTLEKGKHSIHISTDFQSGEVQPQDHKNITIYFHPLILGEHNLELPFYVDGKKVHVTILGKAVPLKLTLVNQTEKFIDLGSVLVGKTCTKTIRILNESLCSVNLFFNFWNRLPRRAPKESPDTSIEVPKEEAKIKKEGKKEDKSSKDSKSKKKGGKKSDKKSSASKKTQKSKDSKKSKGSKKDKKGKKKSDKGSKVSKEKKSAIDLHKTETEVKPPKQGIDYMTISPDKCLRLTPQKVTEFTVTFNPQEKVESFVEKVFYRVQDYVEAFCVVKGRAIAPDISLDRYHLTFGNVVVNFERTMHVVLRNTGDVSLRFKWLLDKRGENYSITPNKGYILPNTDIIFDVIFRPKVVKCWIKSRLICHIEGINKQLKLDVSGSCINVPSPKAVILFNCPVRESEIKTITISNPSNQTWNISPRISGDISFKTLEITRIPPKHENKIEITFAPMILHEQNATLCIPTPDGLITSYTLKGIVHPPNPAGKITREVLCKVQHAEELSIRNWLLVKQQFQVSTTVNGHATPKDLFTVGGNNLIDVPGNSLRNYDWTVTPINEGQLELKVIFTNKITKEYLFYEISLKVLPNKQLDSIEFSTCARKMVTKLIKLENPLNVPVVYHMTCLKSNLTFEKTVTLDSHSVYFLEIKYSPLHEEKETVLFEATCQEMGAFCYNLILIAYAPFPEPPVIFRTYLGHTLTQNMEVFHTRGCEFKFDDPNFFLNTVIGDHTLSVTFEPNQMGKFQSRLLLTSPTAGDFIYPLIGESCSPKPQGPFILSFSNPVTISFKNPFSEEKTFWLRTDPNDFSVKNSSETVGSKGVIKIVVNLLSQRKEEEAKKFPITGKLTISCNSPQISWVYYLQEKIE